METVKLTVVIPKDLLAKIEEDLERVRKAEYTPKLSRSDYICRQLGRTLDGNRAIDIHPADGQQTDAGRTLDGNRAIDIHPADGQQTDAGRTLDGNRAIDIHPADGQQTDAGRTLDGQQTDAVHPTCARTHARLASKLARQIDLSTNTPDLVSPKEPPTPIPEPEVTSMDGAALDMVIMNFKDPDIMQSVLEILSPANFPDKKGIVRKITDAAKKLGEDKVIQIMDRLSAKHAQKHMPNPRGYLWRALENEVKRKIEGKSSSRFGAAKSMRFAEDKQWSEKAHPNNQGVPPPLPRPEKPVPTSTGPPPGFKADELIADLEAKKTFKE